MPRDRRDALLEAFPGRRAIPSSLRRGGVEVVLASIKDDLAVRAAQAVTLQADAPSSALDLIGFDMAVVPGGAFFREGAAVFPDSVSAISCAGAQNLRVPCVSRQNTPLRFGSTLGFSG